MKKTISFTQVRFSGSTGKCDWKRPSLRQKDAELGHLLLFFCKKWKPEPENPAGLWFGPGSDGSRQELEHHAAAGRCVHGPAGSGQRSFDRDW